jgi:pimeloyl-ACP methyl ester carboxylesterase
VSTRSKRVGLVGAAAGVIAAGAAVVLAVDRTSARRHHDPTATAALAARSVDRSGRVVADDGVGLYYEEVGPSDAPLTVVFVHGYTLAMGSFVFQRRALAEQFGDRVRLVFFDQRSHGRSDRSESERASIDQLGRDLACVLDTLVPNGPIVLVGHSMGGMSVLALAAERPELFAAPTPAGPGPALQRVTAVALLSTSAGRLGALTLGLPAAVARLNQPLLPMVLRTARKRGDLIERGRALGAEVAWVLTRRLSFAGAEVDPATVDYLAEMIGGTRIEVVADFYPAIVDHDKLAALPRLSAVDVLVLCGDHDLLTPLSHSTQMAAALPQARLVVVEDSGHVALMERPEVVTEALAELIEGALIEEVTR